MKDVQQEEANQAKPREEQKNWRKARIKELATRDRDLEEFMWQTKAHDLQQLLVTKPTVENK